MELRLLTPTGHLGFTPLEPDSFRTGMALRPDCVVADSGSCDIGPHPLGADEPCSPHQWQYHDLEIILLECRRQGIPMIIGSASDTGTNRGVDQYVQIIRDVARRHRLAPFRLAYIYADIPMEEIARRMAAGTVVQGLDGRPDLTPADLERTDHIVAVMGPEPIMSAISQGADVVIAGRASDSALFAAPALFKGFDRATAFYAGKVLECASFCAEPYMGKESVLGTLRPGEVVVEPMHPGQHCTPKSLVSHAMYERSTPFQEHVPGGVLEMGACQYTPTSDRTTRVTDFRFAEADRLMIKLEGAGKVGERCLAIVGFRDPEVIARIDAVIDWAKSKVRARFGDTGYELHYHVYGRNAVLPAIIPDQGAVELGVVVEGVAPTREQAAELTAMGARQMFYARLPNIRGTAGTAALMSDEVLDARPAYKWTINHIIPVSDPTEFFSVHIITVD